MSAYFITVTSTCLYFGLEIVQPPKFTKGHGKRQENAKCLPLIQILLSRQILSTHTHEYNNITLYTIN